jgi:hypothetical protein
VFSLSFEPQEFTDIQYFFSLYSVLDLDLSSADFEISSSDDGNTFPIKLFDFYDFFSEISYLLYHFFTNFSTFCHYIDSIALTALQHHLHPSIGIWILRIFLAALPMRAGTMLRKRSTLILR